MEKATSATCFEWGRSSRLALLCFLAPLALSLAPLARAQQDPEIRQILERLDRLERQNTELRSEVVELRKQLSAAGGPEAPSTETVEKLADTVAVQGTRIEEQAQSKVESIQRFPIRITGMALFNAYANSSSEGSYSSPIATSAASARSAGGTLSQSILGLEFFGPGTFLGGKISGNLSMDFYQYTGAYEANPPAGASAGGLPLHLRTGAMTIDWGSRSLMVGVEKPLISMRNPDSLAQVGLPALSGSGNLWDWQPQVRVEQNFRISPGNEVTAQGALYATRETNTQLPASLGMSVESTRPGWEGRLQFAHKQGDEPFVELAPGFHYSVSHVGGYSIASQIASLDGLLRPVRFLELTGTFFYGQNVAGLGGLGPGFQVTPDGDPYSVHSRGGWLQLALFPTQRLSFRFFGGTQINRPSDLAGYYPQSNLSYAGNAYYQLAPNVFLAFEAAQTRTTWTNGVTHLRNHYDLALAYKF